ncbi:MAG: GIY-YIG nuclease family protein [Terriglobales bacterium]
MKKLDRVVYVIRNRANGKRYVGISKFGAAHRWRCHVRDSLHGGKRPLQRAIRKYGLDAFTISVLERCTTDCKLKAAEVRWIAKLGTYRHGYNCTIGGDGTHGLKFSPERLRKHAATMTRPEVKRKIRAAWIRPEVKAKRAAAIRANRIGTRCIRVTCAVGRTHAHRLPENLIIKLYEQGWPLSAIARKVGTGTQPSNGGPRRSRIRNVLKRAGVYRKPGGAL